ncbi:Rv1733c family protein [Streptomyces camelliae]|uniref:Proline rich protein membrane protein n=1 Tax=Streptomyces camelliae TaxID=3004093 RepID=A0ABY7NY43_9ACTN|nr:hypothetical protein [Streptomyces sp. HUAS 2-6]WBO62179.1 hypothetical protein O1G22_04745 [Streptomyces sp. HUAS 2-6]
MSAQDWPHASGPCPPHQEHPSKGTNPLRRPSDRIENWFFRFLMLVLVIGLPVASVRAGLTAYQSQVRAVHAQTAERHQVSARLTSQPRAVPSRFEDTTLWARVRWTERDGRQRTGTASVPEGRTAGSAVWIWVDRQGRVEPAPMSPEAATTTGWLVGGTTAVAVAMAAFAAHAGMRLVLDRRRYAQWDTEWDVVEPVWSARFRR